MKTYQLWLIGLLVDSGRYELSDETMRFVWGILC